MNSASIIDSSDVRYWLSACRSRSPIEEDDSGQANRAIETATWSEAFDETNPVGLVELGIVDSGD